MQKQSKKGPSTYLQRRLAESEDFRRFYARDSAMLSVTATLIEEMEAQGISRAELAQRIGRTKAFVSQVLTGQRNMTLVTIADIAAALGKVVAGVELRDIGGAAHSAQAAKRQARQRAPRLASA